MPAIDFRTATPDELAAIDPADFIAAVKSMSDRDLRELMEGPNRSPIVTSIFTRMPQLFRPERAGATSGDDALDASPAGPTAAPTSGP